ncbi:beta strand repeat-containing protein [Erythrobacter sp.]|uniref:beta strand repeat-containing protein n=1 Tax=Erythrobacter sp. TaxID=1042 RepID=UPI003C746B61
MALALVTMPTRASAQAINATEDVVAGTASRILTGMGTEDIEVESDFAIIDWTPFVGQQGDAFDFLPTDNTVTFRNSGETFNADFAVLNRILPDLNGNMVVFDGTVLSRIFDAQGVNPDGVAGGTVAFYSPTGIMIGSSAVFDVGNLILTTLEPDDANFADFATNGAPLLLGTGDAAPQSITVQPNAQFVATAENSYLAMVSAQIQMFGTTGINGSQAYVGGEVVSLTVSNGLFDIAIPVGSSVDTPIEFNGDIGGPSSTGVGDNHLIYAVASGQFDPISMIFSGNLGFEPAQSAGIVNGEIILSANYEVSGRTVDGGSIVDGIDAVFDGNSELTSAEGSIQLDNFDATSSVLAIANGDVVVSAVEGSSSVDGNLLAVGRNLAELGIIFGGTFDISGDVLISASDYGEVSPAFDVIEQADASAGTAAIDVLDGTMTIGGSVRVSAEAFAGADTSTGGTGVATGGNAAISATEGSLTIAGDVSISASAFGSTLPGRTFAGDVSGGQAELFASDGGSVVIEGDATLDAEAIGTNGDATQNSLGSDAFGGLAIIEALSGGALTVEGVTQASVSAIAGASNTSAMGALADAGEVVLIAQDTETIDLQADVTLLANAEGGANESGTGGLGLGGAARIFAPSGGSVGIGGNFSAQANGEGGSGVAGGGDGFGGIAGAQVIEGGIDIAGSANVEAIGLGGAASASAQLPIVGDGGTGTGGNAFLQADGTLTGAGTLNIAGDAGVDARGLGGAGGNQGGGRGGEGIGGALGTANQADDDFGGGAYILAGGDNGNLSIAGTATADASGLGGAGGSGGFVDPAGGRGGDGSGGTAQVGMALLDGDGSVGLGSATFGDVLVFSNGAGGSGGAGQAPTDQAGDGGDGTGGIALITARVGALTAQDIQTLANASGGDGANGGSASAGPLSALLVSNGANVAIASFIAGAVGEGGQGFDGIGGAGQGGTTLLEFGDGSTVIDGDVDLDASGLGGASTDGTGADGTGGIASVSTPEGLAGTGAVTGNAAIIANGTGGDTSNGFVAGVGFGGEAFVRAQQGGSITLGSAQVRADGTGGSGDSAVGGDGSGGLAYVEAFGAESSVVIENDESNPGSPDEGAQISATGFGGVATGGSGIGGVGTGGLARVSAFSGGSVTLPSGEVRFVAVNARGFGGGSSVEGGTGGIGTGGVAAFEADEGTVATGATSLSAFGVGGSSTDESLNIAGGAAFGGTREIIVANGSSLSGEFAAGTSGGLGGDGSGTGNGGDATGGTNNVLVEDSTFEIIGNSLFGEFTEGGSGAVGGSATGGTVIFEANDATIAFVDNADGLSRALIGGTTSGGLGIDQGGDAQGAVVSVQISGSDVTGSGSFEVRADGQGGGASDDSGIGGDASAGTASISIASSTVSLAGPNLVSAAAVGGNGSSGGNAFAGSAALTIADSDVDVGSDDAGTASLIVSSNAVGGSGSENYGDATAAEAILAVTGASLTAQTIRIEADAQSTGDSDTASGGSALGGSAQASFEDASMLDAERLELSANASGASGGSAIAGLADLLVSGAENSRASILELSTNATGSDENVTGRFSVTVEDGELAVGSLIGSALGNQLASDPLPSSVVAEAGNLTIEDSAQISTSDSFEVRAISGGTFGGDGAAIDIASERTIAIFGDNDEEAGFTGDTVTLVSNDIEINAGARIAAASLDLVSTNAENPSFIGGPGGATNDDPELGYVLSQEEIDRLDIAALGFSQTGLGGRDPAGADLVIGDARFSGSDIGNTSQVQIEVTGSQGAIRIEGTLEYDGAGIEDRLSLVAAERVEIRTPGGILVRDSDFLPSGSLTISSGNIWIADGELVDQLLLDPLFDGRNEQLSTAAPGSENSFGFVQAGSIEISVGDSLLVRNTGSEGELRGLLVGEGGLSITQAETGSQTALDVFAYGARLDGSGELVSGEAFFREVDFDMTGTPGSLYSDDSELNNCNINTGECEREQVPPSPFEFLVPVNNREIVEAAITTTQPPVRTAIESDTRFGIDFPSLLRAPLIDDAEALRDPVASGSDSALYVADPDDQAEEDDADEDERGDDTDGEAGDDN